MKKVYGTILTMVMVLMMVWVLPCQAVEEEEDIWVEDEPRWGQGRFELTDEVIERILERIAERNPDEAEELRELREENPDEFMEIMRQRCRKRFKERMEGRFRPRPHMPFVGPPGKGPKAGPPFGERLRFMHDKYLEWLERNYPQEAEKLARLREERPELYMRQLGLSWKKFGRIAEAARENPELAEVLKHDLELRERRDEIIREIRATTDKDKKEQLIGQLKELVSNRFDLIVKRKQIEYEHLRKKLEELRKEVEQRKAEVAKWKEAKDEQVKKRVDELIGEAEEFTWD